MTRQKLLKVLVYWSLCFSYLCGYVQASDLEQTKKLAVQGDADAQYELGMLYDSLAAQVRELGSLSNLLLKSTPSDLLLKSQQWFLAAANQGHKKSIEALRVSIAAQEARAEEKRNRKPAYPSSLKEFLPGGW